MSRKKYDPGDTTGPYNLEDTFYVTEGYQSRRCAGAPDILLGGSSVSGGRSGYIITEKGLDWEEALLDRYSTFTEEGIAKLPHRSELEVRILSMVQVEEPNYWLLVTDLSKWFSEDEIKSVLRLFLKRGYIVGPKVYES